MEIYKDSMASTPTFDYLTPILDLDINPDYFIKWLELEKQDIYDKYCDTVFNMCEYSCLYLAMKFRLSKLKGELLVIDGNFTNNKSHFWMEYTIDDKTYIIDITLQQFIPTAPRLSIIEAVYSENGYIKDRYCDYSYTVKAYCDYKRAFMYYQHPLAAEK